MALSVLPSTSYPNDKTSNSIEISIYGPRYAIKQSVLPLSEEEILTIGKQLIGEDTNYYQELDVYGPLQLLSPRSVIVALSGGTPCNLENNHITCSKTEPTYGAPISQCFYGDKIGNLDKKQIEEIANELYLNSKISASSKLSYYSVKCLNLRGDIGTRIKLRINGKPPQFDYPSLIIE